MSRNTDLSTVLFPVEVRPIGLLPELSADDDDQQEGGCLPTSEAIEQYKAIVRTDTGTIFSIVSSQYQLLHNSRALDLGKQAFKLLFSDAGEKDFIPYDIRSTQTGTACHIDLIHKSYDTKVWDQETWLPFLRVSNSYNRSRALTFDFGFVRSLCSNGIIFHKESIQAKFYHTKGELNIDLTQDKKFKKLKELEAEFSGHMKRLREIELTKELITALSLHLLNLSFDLKSDNPKRQESEHERFSKVANKLREKVTTYIKELGPNAYTALNAATDVATHNPTTAGKFATTASLQQAIGQRMQEISTKSPTNGDITTLLQTELTLLNSA